MSASPQHYVWRERSWPLTTLTAEQYERWVADGYLVVPNAVPAEACAAAARTIREFVGADDAEPSTWYANVHDIYADTLPGGAKPHHGPCGMVQLCHHRTLWALRQEPRVHGIFADLYGTRRLLVTCDRAHFKPPQSSRHPAWSDPGEVHWGLHWDVDTLPHAWPVPFVIQGVVYLERTTAELGALRVVPGFHRRFAAWEAAQPAGRDSERPDIPMSEAVAVEAEAGSLVLWHSLLPHGPGPNTGAAPRVSAYVAMHPVDAAPFLGPGRPADAPLSMSDAGTLKYLVSEQTQAPPTATPEAEAAAPLRRQSRERRAERWRSRLPMLDEDPTEAELARRPPGEADGLPFGGLTPLGERLVGLVEWEAE